MKAFVIDDDPILLAMLGFMLTDSGIEARYCLSPVPDSIISDLIIFQPDVIVLDLYLKNESGFDVARKIRSKDELQHIPILAMSSSKELQDRVSAFTSGFLEYINKPFSKEDIISAVKRNGYSNEIIKLCNRIQKREEDDRDLYTRIFEK